MKKRNRKSFGKIINWQRTHVKEGSNTGNGNLSLYWQWVQQHSEKNEEGEIQEPSQANPDVIGDYDNYDNERSYYTQILDKGYQLLSLREKQVFNFLRIGMDEGQIASRLKVARTTIKNHREGIRNKFLKVGDIQA